MPRARRIYLENAIYYVILEGPSHEQVFRDKADYLKYMELLAKYRSEYQFKLFSYALLPNQICLLIEPNEEFPVSQIMQKITPTYTKYYNAKYERRGHLFQKRYRLVYVEKSTYLLRLTRFIHLMPEHAQPRASFKEYPYSSYASFAKTNTLPSSVELSREAGEVLNDLTKSNSSWTYEEFMHLATAEELEFLEKRLSRGFFLGSDEFITEVKKRMEEEAVEKEKPGDGSAIEKPWVTRTSTVLSKGKFALAGFSALAAIVSGILAFQLTQGVFRLPKTVSSVSHMTVPGTVTSQPPVPRQASILVPASVKSELNGTVWEVELILVSPEGVRTPIKDKIKFVGSSFESYYFASHEFSRSNYTVTVNNSGVVTWETMQTNPNGEVVSWRGDWNGRQMEGVLSYHPVEGHPQDFSFMSDQFGVQK